MSERNNMVKEEKRIKALKNKNIKLNSEINEYCYMVRILRKEMADNDELIEELERKMLFDSCK
jgi:hypothetical protein